MKLLYISSLPQTMSGGPKYSVPKQVDAQAKFDEVKWINVSHSMVGNSITPCELINNFKKTSKIIIEFNPHLVIFEEFLYLKFVKIAHYLRKKNIPYIIIPRGCMTQGAQKQKALKKGIANIFLFNRFSRKALAIQYLTLNEKRDSSKTWNKKSLIVPNGTDIPKNKKTMFNTNSAIGTFIGRIDLYHKGIDLFLLACRDLSSLIIDKNVVLNFYGPAELSVREQIEEQVKLYGLQNNIFLHPEVYGEDKNSILLKSDFFILTSRFEGMPMGLLEALAYGLPVLVTEGTNMGTIIREKGAGLVSNCDYKEIAINLRNMLTLDIASYKKMGENARKLALQYTWDNIASETHKQYLELLELEE